MTGGGGAIFGQFVVVLAFLAAGAPLILSLMARSAISIAASVVLLAGAGFLVAGPSVMHQILSALLYLAALTSASVIYVGYNVDHRLKEIAEALAKSRPAPEQPRTVGVSSPSPAPVPPPDSDWAQIKAEVPRRL